MLSNKQSILTPKLFGVKFIALSFIGFLDASYLTAQHFLAGPLPCVLFHGCDIVTTSKYATIFGVPIALLGALYYITIFILAIIYLDTKNEKIFYFAAKLTVIGFLASLFLLYLQIFVIAAICFYCVTSAVTSTLLFVVGIWALKARPHVPK